VYRCGDFIDLCRGPHVPNTGRVKWIKCLSASASTGKLSGVDIHLNRVYGISFPTIEEGKKWEERRAELERRDHRAIGQRQNLLMFSELSPGSAFFLPDGAFVYNRLLEFLREQYRLRGFQEVITPVLYQKKLWEISGHWDHYKRDMFFVEGEEAMGLKPMNCPSHCLIFDHASRSHRELPIRFADFGVLHRNEESGALSGLTRVRKFQQDDAHIFCREDQLQQELAACLDFLRVV
jgi:threonyl-tRNA synthetase